MYPDCPLLRKDSQLVCYVSSSCLILLLIVFGNSFVEDTSIHLTILVPSSNNQTQVSPLNHPRESGHKNFISTLRKYVRKTVSMSLTIRLAGPLHHGAQHSIRMEMNQGTFVIASPSFR